jgi:hypothetical protein
MTDLLTADAGVLKEIRGTSCDPKHSVANCSADADGFWVTTGAFPQEIAIVLNQAVKIEAIHIASRGVKQLRLYDDKGQLLDTNSWPTTGNIFEKQKHTCSMDHTKVYSGLRIQILRGLGDFASVMSVQVIGKCIMGAQFSDPQEKDAPFSHALSYISHSPPKDTTTGRRMSLVPCLNK